MQQNIKAVQQYTNPSNTNVLYLQYLFCIWCWNVWILARDKH